MAIIYQNSLSRSYSFPKNTTPSKEVTNLADSVYRSMQNQFNLYPRRKEYNLNGGIIMIYKNINNSPLIIEIQKDLQLKFSIQRMNQKFNYKDISKFDMQKFVNEFLK